MVAGGTACGVVTRSGATEGRFTGLTGLTVWISSAARTGGDGRVTRFGDTRGAGAGDAGSGGSSGAISGVSRLWPSR